MSDFPSPSISTGIHHIALRVTDFDRTLKFYCDGLGFTRKMIWNMGQDGELRAAMLDAGDGNYLEIFSNGKAEDPAEARFAHVCFRTNNVQASFDAALAAGATERTKPTSVDVADQVTGGPVPLKLAFVHGPDGEIIEFIQCDVL